MLFKNLHLGFIIFLLSLLSIEMGDFSLCSEQPLRVDFEVETEIGRPQRVVKKIQIKVPIKISGPVQTELEWIDHSESVYSIVCPQPTLNYFVSGAKQAKEQTTSAS